MAGTGYHTEGHQWKPYVSRTRPEDKWICGNCALVSSDPARADRTTECIDDC
jgi:hypothetical protein